MGKNKITQYLDATEIRLKNKRISFKEEKGKILILFEIADVDAEKPACRHRTHKGKIRETLICLSSEVMEILALTYLKNKKN